MLYADYSLKPSTHAALEAMGYETPTPIQEQAIPLLLQGEDVIGKAQTGTGKTAAFGVPLIEALGSGHDGVVGLVLVPTRELAIQVHGVLRDLAKGTRLSVVKVFGGTGFGAQIANLSRNEPILLVACPGRLLDLVNRGVCDLSHVEFLVLDEADRMLDMGFIHDMKKIFRLLPDQRQSALFSATLDQRVRGIAHDILRKPETVEIASKTTAIELTEQFHTRLEKSAKKASLLNLLHAEHPDRAVVFMRTKHQAKRMAQQLSKAGWNSVALQGNMTQNQREKSMATFKDGKARILVATDVAARGLDVDGVTHVINHDIPQEPEQYVHRVGRTGRNGATGRSFTFVQSDEVPKWKTIKRLAGSDIPHHVIEPTDITMGPDPVPEPPQRHPRPKAGNGPRRGRKPQQGNGRRNGGARHGGGRPQGNGPRRSRGPGAHRGPRRD